MTLNNDKLLEIIHLQTEVVEQGMDLAGIMELVAQRTQMITQADGATVELIVTKKQLVYSAASGVAQQFLGLRMEIANSLSGECVRKRIPLISNDIEKDHRVNKTACRRFGLNSMIVVPLICQRETVGVLKLLSHKIGHFTDDNIQILELMSGLIAAAIFSAKRTGESELFYSATHDSLTGISNRSVFYDHLRRRLEQGQPFGVVSMDIDGLKEINDQLGHRAGDASIKELAARISSKLRKTDTFSRLGGDEFGIIAAFPTRKQVDNLLKHLEHELEKPFMFEGHPVRLRASMGYALYDEDGIELEQLVEKADKTMYEEKRKRKGSIR